MDQIKWKGKDYPIRELYLGKNRGYKNVAQIALSEALQSKDGEYRGKSAEVDALIWYYCDELEWVLSDKELLKTIKTNS